MKPIDEETSAPRNRRRWLVVAYDISNDKRRTKVMKTLEGYGRRVQYSVFECELRPEDVTQLQTRLRRLIVEAEDDVRFYALCANCLQEVITLGRGRLHRYGDFAVVERE